MVDVKELVKEFLRDFGLEAVNTDFKIYAITLLREVLSAKENKYMEVLGLDQQELDTALYEEVEKENKPFVSICKIAGYWYNDLIDVAAEFIERDGVTPALFDDIGNISGKMFEWLDKRLKKED